MQSIIARHSCDVDSERGQYRKYNLLENVGKCGGSAAYAWQTVAARVACQSVGADGALPARELAHVSQWIRHYYD